MGALSRTLATAVTAAAVTAVSGCFVATETRTTTPTARPEAPQTGGGDGGNGYAFLHTTRDGEPVRWSTCRPIRYVVRPDHEPEGARRLLEASLRQVADATGLRFEAVGTTDEAPAPKRRPYQPDRYGNRWAPVLLAYSTPEESPRLAGRRAGYGGPTVVRQRGGTPRYVSGSVVLDADQVTSTGGDEAIEAVMLHELGHLVGLAHVEDTDQLMNPVIHGRQVTELQDGDLAGLREVGDGTCYEPIEPGRFGRASNRSRATSRGLDPVGS